MWLFKKPEKPPVDKVLDLSKQGKSEAQVSESLKNEGFAPTDINKAYAGAVRSAATAPAPSRQFAPMSMAPQQEPVTQFEIPSQKYEDYSTEAPQEYEPVEPQQQQRGWTPEVPETGIMGIAPPSAGELEEIVESVVDEKWRELQDRLEDMHERLDAMEAKITSLDVQINTLKDAGSSERSVIESKIDEYKGSIDGIESRIGSIERAFKETLPSMIDSVKSVTEVVAKLKAEQQ
jgi:prefoldin subunit 5